MLAAIMSPSAFELAVQAIGSYRAIGALFDPPISVQAVAKWASAGVPPERVIAVATAAGFRPRPHDLRPDLYPHPDDGLPDDMRGRAVA